MDDMGKITQNGSSSVKFLLPDWIPAVAGMTEHTPEPCEIPLSSKNFPISQAKPRLLKGDYTPRQFH